MNCRYRIVYFDSNDEYIDEVESLYFENGNIVFDQVWKSESRPLYRIDYIEVDVARPADL